MKNIFIFLLSGSLFFSSCFSDSALGLEIIAVPFILFGGKTVHQAPIADPLHIEEHTVELFQTGNQIHVGVKNPKTGGVKKDLTHKLLVTESLEKILKTESNLQFLYPEGTLILHSSTGQFQWEKRE